jgi:hypothetical protein
MYNKQMMLEGPVSKDYNLNQYPTPNPRYKNSHPTFLRPALTLSPPTRRTAHWPPHRSKAGKRAEALAAALAIQCSSSTMHGPYTTTLRLCLQRVAALQLLPCALARRCSLTPLVSVEQNKIRLRQPQPLHHLMIMIATSPILQVLSSIRPSWHILL